MARKRTAPRIAPPRAVLPKTKPTEECFHYPSCLTWEGIEQTNQVLSERIASGALELRKGIPELPEVLWLFIFEYFIKDRCGNPTVPALAQLAWLRQLCRATRDAAAQIDTPFDALIEWTNGGAAGGVPREYTGGVAFGEFKYAPALAILRCKDNGRMFAVNPHQHMFFEKFGDNEHLYDHKECYFEVDRFYSLRRLTQLLCCHTAQWNLRLADVHTLAFFDSGDEQPMQGRRLTHEAGVIDAFLNIRREGEDEGLPCFVEPEQNLKSTIVSEDGSVIVERYDDYVSFAVDTKLIEHRSGHGFYKRYEKKGDLVLVQQDLDYEGGDMAVVTGKAFRYYINPEKAWAGKRHNGFSFRLSPDNWPGGIVSRFQLIIALGYLADCKQVRGPDSGWLVSVFDHYDGKYGFQEWELESKSKAVQRRMQKLKEESLPTHFDDMNMKDEITMQLMAKFAMMADKSLAATKPTTTRTRRGAAAQARQQMSRIPLPCSAPLGSKTKVTVKIPTDDESDQHGEQSEGESDFDDSGSEYVETVQERRDRKEVEAEDEAGSSESYASDVSEVGETKKKKKRKRGKKAAIKPGRRAKKVEEEEEEEEEQVDAKTLARRKAALRLRGLFFC